MAAPTMGVAPSTATGTGTTAWGRRAQAPGPGLRMVAMSTEDPLPAEAAGPGRRRVRRRPFPPVPLAAAVVARTTSGGAPKQRTGPSVPAPVVLEVRRRLDGLR